MNIGIVTTWFERGASYVSRAYKKTLSRQHTVYIYARGGEQFALGDPDWDQDDVTWGKCTFTQFPTYIDWKDFTRWITKERLDVVIFNEQVSWDVILRSLKLDVLIGAYVDYYTHETVPFFNLYDFLLCNTHRHYSVFKEHPQAIYIPWGTDCQLFKPGNDSRGDKVRFFHSAGMGGVNLRKGTDLLVRAFQAVSGAARLLIHSQVGLEKYSDVADIIQTDPRIEFIQATVKAPGLYHRGDVYVYPTRLEGIGLTIAEALACGLPAITTNSAPMSEFVQDGVTGQLVAVENTQMRSDEYYWPESLCSIAELTRAMQFYVDTPTELTQHKQNARQHALQHLNWGKNSANLPQTINQLKKLPKNKEIQRKALRHERKTLANAYIAAAFEHHRMQDYTNVRRSVARGLAYQPRWIKNAGVRSIMAEALVGKRTVDLLRKSILATRSSAS